MTWCWLLHHLPHTNSITISYQFGRNFSIFGQLANYNKLSVPNFEIKKKVILLDERAAKPILVLWAFAKARRGRLACLFIRTFKMPENYFDEFGFEFQKIRYVLLAGNI